MSNKDNKFWIGISSAFIIPTLAYVYSQGMTAQSINQLSTSVDKYQATVDSLNNQILIIANNNNNNTAEIASVNKHLDTIDLEVNEQNRRILIIETKQEKGKLWALYLPYLAKQRPHSS